VSDRHSEETSYFKDNYWDAKGSSKLLAYVGPPTIEKLEKSAVKRFVREKGAMGAMWSYDQGYAEQGPWYRCICDTPDYDISSIKSKNARHNIKRSLKRCTFRKVEYQWLADNGYDVYVNASARYKDFIVESKDVFQNKMLGKSDIPGAEAFGVFVDDKLVAYMTLFICGENVRGDIAHFDPAYSNSYPMFALYFNVTQHYLKAGAYKEVDRGWRALVHETNIDDFLMRIGYHKSYCRLGMHLALPVRIVLTIARIFRKLYKHLLPSRYCAILNGLLLAQDIARETSNRD
jgi:hypothetical protein